LFVDSYLLSIDTATELEEYLAEILDITMPANKNFVQELLERWRQRNGKMCEPVANCAQVCILITQLIKVVLEW